MRATICKMHLGKKAVQITKTFSDVVGLYEFLRENNITVSPSELALDLQCEEVTYTTALTNVSQNSEYN